MMKSAAGYGTEYTDNYNWDSDRSAATSRTKAASGLLDRTGSSRTQYPVGPQATMLGSGGMDPRDLRDPSVFPSEIYPSVYRETVIHKDDRGRYIDPFLNIANKEYGRRLMYDPSHPDKMYPSQWSSELADPPGPYSFPTTTGLQQEIPWRKDLQWQVDGEEGTWPTDTWKQWTAVACSPPYDGHDDQVEYSKYKVQIP